MFSFRRLNSSQELKKAPTPPAQQPPPPVTPAPPQPQVNSRQCNNPLPAVETLVTDLPAWGHTLRSTDVTSSPQQMLRRGKANGTPQFQWPWPSPPSSPLPQRCPLLSPWRPLPPAPRPRSSRRWAPSWRRPSSEEARARTVCMEAGRVVPSSSSSPPQCMWEDTERGQTNWWTGLKLTQKSPPDYTRREVALPSFLWDPRCWLLPMFKTSSNLTPLKRSCL